MKLHVIVAPRHDLDFIIEEEYTDIKSNISVYDLVSELAQTPNLTEKSITVIVDGAVVPFADWKKYFLSEEKNHEIKFILEPEGTVVMVAFVFIAMVATFLYTMRMMHKLNSKTGTDSSGESRSIYDVNAQGNKIKLGDVIPEQFGHFKKFPDYLADAHSFYRDNEYYLDLILSQGIGYFQHDLSDIYVGATPISVLQGVQCEVCEPSADLSQNGIAPEITKCWYNSTEVTNSGHTLHPIEKSPDKMIHLEYQSIFVEDWDRLKEFDVGDIIRLTGVSNQWVVTPALQEIKSNRPQILDSRGMTRVQHQYKCPFAHEAEFAFTPLYSAGISWQPPQNNGRYNFGIATGFWTDVVAHNYVLGQPTAFKLVCDTSSFSIRGSWSSAVTEDDGLYITTYYGSSRTDLNWDSISFCGTSITKNDEYHGLYATLGGINGDAGQSLLMSSSSYDVSYMLIRYGYSGAEDYYNYDNANFTITYGRNNDPWNYRFLPGSKFTVTVIPAVCVKVTKCTYRPELENKFVILPCMLSGEKVSTYTHELPLLGAVGDYYAALFRRSDYVSHIVFDVLDRTSKIPTPISKIGWPRGTFSDLSPAQQTEEDFYQYTHNAIDFDEDRAGFQFEVDGTTVIYGNLTRITATPSEHWRCYNEQNNIIDDNGYYKVMAVYGGGICRRDSSDTSVSTDSDRIATTFGFNCAEHTRFLTNTSDSYCPNLTKIKVARCDRHGNLIANWDGFFNCVSQSNQIILQNITKGIATNDSAATGPYRAAPIGVDVSEVEIDLYAPGGIYYRNDQGGIERYSVTVRIEYKKAGELSWQYRDVTMSSYGHKRIVSYDPPEYEQTGIDAVGVTEVFNLTPGDWYFRCYRLTEEHEDDTTHYSDVVKWTGLKSVIANPQSYDDITVLLMRFRGSETLSEMSDNQISTLFTRMLPNIETNVLEPTSALAPAVKYICDHSKFASLLHIDNLADMNAIWNVRGLDLNGTLDSDNTLLNVLSDILHIGYSELSTRADGLQIVQIGEHPNVDYEQGGSWDAAHLSGPTDYSFIFSPQNYSNLKIDVALPRRDDAEEIEVQYTDVETYKTATVYIHMSSSQYSTIEVTDYPTSIYQEKLQLFGVTEKAQAVAMGARRLRTISRNRIKFSLTTEFDSLNCNYKDFVGLVVDEPTCGMLTAEMRHKPNYGNEYIVTSSNWANNGYSGRVTNYSNGVIEINPPLTAEQYGGSGNVAHRPTAFFITDEEGQPHLLSINYNDWIDSKSFRATLPVTWYGEDIELPRIVSAVIIPCWVEKIKPSEKNCTIELTMYDSSIFTDDLPMREGYGVSAYGTSPYGKSY